MMKLFIGILFFPILSLAQSYGDVDFYLIDSLDLDAISQSERDMVDSCLTVFHETKEDTNKVTAIEFIIEQSWDDNVWPRYNQWLHDYLEQKIEKQGLNSDVKKRLQVSFASCITNIGYLYNSQGNKKKALEYYLKGINTQLELGDKKGVADSYNNIGWIYQSQGDMSNALDYYHKSLKIKEEINDLEGLGYSLNNIGFVHQSQEDYETAFDYYKKSLEARKEVGDKRGVATCLNNIAYLYKLEDKFDLALENYFESLKLREELGLQKEVVSSLLNIGAVYKTQGDQKKALEYFNLGLDMSVELGYKIGEAKSLHNIAYVEISLEQYGSAESRLTKAMEIAMEMQYLELISSNAEKLYDVYKHSGQHKKALEMYELHIKTNDSISNQENQKAAIQQQFKYEYEKKTAADSIQALEEAKVQEALLTAEKAETEKQKAQVKQQEQQKYYLFAGLGLALLFGVFIFNRFRVTSKQKDIIEDQKALVEQQKTAVEEQKVELENTHQQLEEHHKEIADSIMYAKRIQEAIMPSMDSMNSALKDGFVLYLPKDVVAGDFFWMEQLGDVTYYAAADCTGHGVPGAMVSVVCSNALNKALLEEGIRDTGKLLDRTREIVIDRLAKSGEEVKDGMDISLCALNLQSRQMQWSGANNPIWINRQGSEEIEEIKANKQPIGKYAEPKPFTAHQIQLSEGDTIYVFTDGYQDQFGGPKGKKFKAKQLKDIIIANQTLSMDKQMKLLQSKFMEWKGEVEQIDDVCIIGVRI